MNSLQQVREGYFITTLHSGYRERVKASSLDVYLSRTDPKIAAGWRACLKSGLGYSYHSHIPFLRKSITCSLSNQLLPLLISTHSLSYQFLWAGACLQKAWVDLSRHLYAFLDVRVNYTSLLEVHQLK